MSQPTSMRLSEEEIELIDSMREYLNHKTGVYHSRRALFLYLLRRVQPPDGTEAGVARWRRAYDRIYNSTVKPT